MSKQNETRNANNNPIYNYINLNLNKLKIRQRRFCFRN